MGISINNAVIKINCEAGTTVDSIEIKNTKNEKHEFSSVDLHLKKELNELKGAITFLIQERCYLGLLDGPRLEHLKSVTIDKTPWLMDDVIIEFETDGKKFIKFFPANWGELGDINDKLKAIAAKSMQPTHSLN